MRMINLLLFFVASVLTLFCGMMMALAIMSDEWLLAYAFGAFGMAAAYMWTKIPLSGGDNKKGKGGSYA